MNNRFLTVSSFLSESFSLVLWKRIPPLPTGEGRWPIYFLSRLLLPLPSADFRPISSHSAHLPSCTGYHSELSLRTPSVNSVCFLRFRLEKRVKLLPLISSLLLLFPNLFLLSALSSSMGLNYHTGSLSTQSRERVLAEKFPHSNPLAPFPQMAESPLFLVNSRCET